MTYKFCRLENEELKKYEFDSKEDAEFWVKERLEEFKVQNRVRDENTDRSFVQYKAQFDKILGV